MNQPIVLADGMCLRNAVYFNETFAGEILREGDVTLYESLLPKGYGGVYKGVGGFSGQGEVLGNNPEDCSIAAKNVDPAVSA